MKAMIRDLLERLKSSWVLSLSLFLVFYFAYHALHGNRGFYRLVELKSELAVAESELEAVTKQRQAVAQKVSLMDPENPDADMVDEQLRAQFGFLKPDEIVIYLEE